MERAHLHRVAVEKLSELTGALATALDDDLVLVTPKRGSVVLGTDADILDAAEYFRGGICVAASPIPLASEDLASKLEDAVSAAVGWRTTRAHPMPNALLGPTGALRELCADLSGRPDADGELIASAVLGGVHNLILDSAAQLFQVLDGTGTDVVAVGGRVRTGGEAPLVVIDLSAKGDVLAQLVEQLEDPGSRDLARLLAYEGAADPGTKVSRPANDVIVTPFWTTDFCATIVRAAEAAGLWMSDQTDPVPGSEVSLHTLSPRLFSLVEEDLEARIWPRLLDDWPEIANTGIHDAFVIRYDAGGPEASLPLHHDVAQLSGSVRLNEGYEGGGLSFPRQGWDNANVPVGSLTVWPSLVTHPHRAHRVTRGIKYGLTIWWRLPGV